MNRIARASPTSRRALAAWWGAVVAAGLAATLIAAGPAQGAVPPEAYDAAFTVFQKAAAGGDEVAVTSAAEQFGRLAAAEPGDPVLLAYSGAATAMRANTTVLPWRKLAFADEGLGRLDKALTLLNPEHDTLLHKNVPASLETRFVAASTFLRLPAMFNRHARGAHLLDDVLTSPLLAASPAGFRAAVWMRAADEASAAQRPAEARRWLQQVVASGAPQADRARAKLKEIAP